MGSDHGNGNNGGAGQQSEAGNAGLAAVEASVGTAGALGVDAEELTVAQALKTGVECGLGCATSGAVHRDGSDGAHEFLCHPPLETGARKIVSLAHENDLAVEHHRQEDGVPHGVVVGREDSGSLGRNVFLAADPRVIGGLQNGAAGRLESLIERHCHS